MAAIAAANVTYTQQGKTIVGESGYRKFNFVVAFGDGALTYPAGGVPLLKASLGCPNSLMELYVIDPANANGFMYKVDMANLKLRIYQGDNTNVAAAPGVELSGSATPAAASLQLIAIGF